MSITFLQLTEDTIDYIKNYHKDIQGRNPTSEFVYKAIKKEPKLSMFIILIFNNAVDLPEVHRECLKNVSKL